MANAPKHPAITAPQNLLDKAIAIIAPGLAVKRLTARATLAAAGGYTGARVDRAQLSTWRPTAGSPATDITPDLPTLRARSRDQMRNAPVAVGALETVVAHAIGTGLSLKPTIDPGFLGLSPDAADAWTTDTARRFAAWATSSDCHAARAHNFYALQDLALRSALESGDAFVLTPMLPRAGRLQLCLQLVEADRVCNPGGERDTDTRIAGIDLDPATGEALAVHIARLHPADATTRRNTWERRDIRGARSGRRNVLHIYKPLRPGQLRGVPWIAPILEPLKQINRYTDAELNAAVVSSVFSVFVKMDPAAFQDVFDEDARGELLQRGTSWSGEMESGKAVNLLPGESIDTAAPGRPNAQFDPFLTSVLRQVGMALQLPYEVLVMHFQSSYSAARGALLLAWRQFRSRRDWITTALCQPVYDLWLADEVAAGRIQAPGFFADPVVRAAWANAQWIGDGPGSIDPQKEVAAARDRVELGISTLDAESILHDGIPWADKQRQRAKEVARQIADGTYTTPAGAAPRAQAVDGPDDDDDTEDDSQGDSQDDTQGATPAGDTPRPPPRRPAPAQVQAQAQAHMQAQIADLQHQLATLREHHHQHLLAAAHPAAPAVAPAEPPVVHLHTNITNTLPGQPAPVVQVDVAAPSVSVQAPHVTLEATVPPAQVIYQHPLRAVQTVERDAATDEITRTVTTFERD